MESEGLIEARDGSEYTVTAAGLERLREWGSLHRFTYADAREGKSCSCGGRLVVRWVRDSPDDPSAVPLVVCLSQEDDAK
jgi:DNA-binding PadR family transcriptional regulator